MPDCLVDKDGHVLTVTLNRPQRRNAMTLAMFARLADAWEIVQQTNDPDSSIILDAFHNWNSNSTLDDLRAIPLDKISHYHIDDADPDLPATTQKDPDRVMLGEGQIDLAAEITVLKEKGYDKTMSLELFNADLWVQDPLDVITEGLSCMKTLWQD